MSKEMIGVFSKQMTRYLKAVKQHLRMPKEHKERVMSDFSTSIAVRLEQGEAEETILTSLGVSRKAAKELNEQLSEFTFRKSPWRFLFLVIGILCVLWFIGYVMMPLAFTFVVNQSVGIIGGADGPTAIYVTKTLAPQLLGAIAIAAYSYMALIPMIQPPFMRLLTTQKERKIKMTALRSVSKLEKILFPILVTVVVGLIVPSALALIGCLMFGNLLNVCGVTRRLSSTVQNGLMNAVTVCLGISVGATATANNFLQPETLLIIALGLTAFCISTVGGLLTAKIMCVLTGGKINPLIGSAGVSAVPMAARVAQKEGQKADPSNFLLMHAMGPNVAGVIGSAVAAGVLLASFA